ncbi:hypothetical protein QYF36_011320 [Acer negundo]|nr:hypothetical protein QYF36_011320 [Acer negundo]
MCEAEEDNIKINEAMLDNVLYVLKSAPASRLSHITLQTSTKHYMGPVFDPNHSAQLVPHDPPFREDLPRLPYRTSTTRLKISYPGSRYTWEHFCDVSDARVLAQQHIWAAVTARGKNQAFNCTNGDVFTWKSLWKVLCDIFDLEYVPLDENDEFDIVGMMKNKGKVWDEIVEKYGLRKTNLEEITCFEAFNNVLHFGFQHVYNMNKNREFGFFGYADTLKSINMWVGKLRDMNVIP